MFFSIVRQPVWKQSGIAFAHQALELAELTRGEIEIFCGNFVCGLLAAENAEYLSARQHLERGLSISQQTRDMIINDPNIALGLLNCTGLLVAVCWILGYPDQARSQAKRLVELLQKALPPNAYAIGTHYLLTMRCDFLREYQGASVHAREALERSTQSGYRWGIVFGAIDLGKIMVAEGAVEEGIEKLRTGLLAHEVVWDQHWADRLAAGAYLSARRLAEGRAIVELAIARMAGAASRLFESDLHRLKGEFLLSAGAPESQVEESFRTAIAVAQRQDAKGWEFRATISLAHLLAVQGRREEAHYDACQHLQLVHRGFRHRRPPRCQSPSSRAGRHGRMTCTNCSSENTAGAKYCIECGEAFRSRCSKCGSVNTPNAKFCQECGTSFDSVAAPAKPISKDDAVIALSHEESLSEIPEGERKIVTALFADIKGSTELMRDLDPEEARAIIDPALRLMIEAAHRYDGYVVQSTGDGIFALFGAPVAHEDHPQRALSAALLIQEELHRYSAKVVGNGGIPIKGRVGANTGEVVMRMVKTGGHTEYSPIGHAINLAQRMESAAPSETIVVSEETRRLVEGYFELRAMGLTEIKGIAEPIEVYEVLGVGALHGPFDLAARPRTDARFRRRSRARA